MRDGNIYHWRWKSDERDADCGPYRAYHCYSRIAVVISGKLCDTYWCNGKTIDPDDVILDYQGNVNEMTEIRDYEAPYYRPEDIVDMRHSNNSNAPIYLRAGAARDAGAMLEYARSKRREAESEMRVASHQIERMDDIEKMILAGRLDEVHF